MLLKPYCRTTDLQISPNPDIDRQIWKALYLWCCLLIVVCSNVMARDDQVCRLLGGGANSLNSNACL